MFIDLGLAALSVIILSCTTNITISLQQNISIVCIYVTRSLQQLKQMFTKFNIKYENKCLKSSKPRRK